MSNDVSNDARRYKSLSPSLHLSKLENERKSQGRERDVGPGGRVAGTRHVPRAEKTGLINKYPRLRRRELEEWRVREYRST